MTATQKYLRAFVNRLPFACYPYKPFMLKHKCIFIHIPKCAGTSVLKYFEDTTGRYHCTWENYYQSNYRRFSSYHKFTIVRDPVARIFSAYKYIIEGGNQSSEDLALQRLIHNNTSTFDEFVDKHLGCDFIAKHVLFKPQYLFIYDSAEKCKVDQVIKYENLNDGWQFLCSTIGKAGQLPTTNVSANIGCELSQQSLSKIQTLYALDFKLLGYEKQ